MNCPYCDFHFKALLANGNLTDDTIAPIICESCGKIGLFESGRIRQITGQELEWIKESPAYINVLDPAQEAILKERKRRNARLN